MHLTTSFCSIACFVFGDYFHNCEVCVAGERAYNFLVCMLSAHGVELSFLSRTPGEVLSVAGSRGWLAVCQLLIEQFSVDPKCSDSRGNTALHFACDSPNDCSEVISISWSVITNVILSAKHLS